MRTMVLIVARRFLECELIAIAVATNVAVAVACGPDAEDVPTATLFFIWSYLRFSEWLSLSSSSLLEPRLELLLLPLLSRVASEGGL